MGRPRGLDARCDSALVALLAFRGGSGCILCSILKSVHKVGLVWRGHWHADLNLVGAPDDECVPVVKVARKDLVANRVSGARHNRAMAKVCEQSRHLTLCPLTMMPLVLPRSCRVCREAAQQRSKPQKESVMRGCEEENRKLGVVEP